MINAFVLVPSHPLLKLPTGGLVVKEYPNGKVLVISLLSSEPYACYAVVPEEEVRVDKEQGFANSILLAQVRKDLGMDKEAS